MSTFLWTFISWQVVQIFLTLVVMTGWEPGTRAAQIYRAVLLSVRIAWAAWALVLLLQTSPPG